MANVQAIVGANWGDEGKGKITDVMAEKADVVVRYQGGANAGHTIINDYGRFALHQLPSGVFYDHTLNVIGPGVALSVDALCNELESLREMGVPKPSLLVDLRTEIVMPYHIAFDTYEEERLGKGSFGSTKSGIAPFYSDKYGKLGFQVCHLFAGDDFLRQRLERIAMQKNVLLEHLYHKAPLDIDALLVTMHGWRDAIEPYVGDWQKQAQALRKKDATILLEGQLGALRDPDHGIYPMTTSSSTLAGFGCIGAGVAPQDYTEIVAVVKAYSSCVGAGAFVSEIFDDEAEELRKRGGDKGEYGATTGRPRRVGWLDLVASRYGAQTQNATQIAFSVIDVLGFLDEIPVCVAYEIDGQTTRDFPVTPLLENCKPVFENLPGWKTDIRGIRRFEDLPTECQNYVLFAEKEMGVPIRMISNGPGREDIIYR